MIPKIDHTNAYTPVLPVEPTQVEAMPNGEDIFLTLESDTKTVVLQIENYTRMIVLRLLKDNNLLDVSTTKMAMNCEKPDDLCCAVCDLCAIDQLNLDSFKIMCEHPKPNYLAQILFRLHKDNLNKISTLAIMHPDAELLWLLKGLLDKAGIPLSKGFFGIAVHPAPEMLLEYLRFLLQNDLPMTKYFLYAFCTVNLSYLLEVMKLLRKADMLTEMNIDLALERSIVHETGVEVLKILVERKILNKNNYLPVLKFDPFSSLKSLITCMNQLGILNQTTFASLLETNFSCILESAVDELFARNFLNETNFLGVASHSDCEGAAQAVIVLRDYGLPELIEYSFVHDSPQNFVSAIIQLHEKELLTEEYRELVFLHDRPQELVEGILFLLEYGKLSLENLEFIFGHSNPKECAEAILELFSDYNFSEEESEEIIKSPKPLVLLQTWRTLKKDHILTPENKKAVGDHEAPNLMAEGISMLHSAKLLDEESLRFISKSRRPDLLARVVVTLAEMEWSHDIKWRCLSRTDSLQYQAIFKLNENKLLDRDALEWLGADNNRLRSKAVLELKEFLNLENFQAIRNHVNPMKLATAIGLMSEKRDLMKYLVKHPEPNILVKGLLLFKENGFSAELFEWLTSIEKDLFEIAHRLCVVSKAGIPPTDKNRDLIRNYPKGEELLNEVKALIKENLFTEDCFQIVAVHSDPISYCKALKSLNGLIDQKHLAQHPFPLALVSVLRYLEQNNFFTEKTVDQVLNHPNMEVLDRVLSYSQIREIPISEFWECVVGHPNIACYGAIIKCLIDRNIFTHLKLAAAHPNPQKLLKIVEALSLRRLLTEGSFQFVVNLQDPSLVEEFLPGQVNYR